MLAMNKHQEPADTRAECCSPYGSSTLTGASMIGGESCATLITEGEGFEPSVRRKTHNGFRDRPEYVASPLIERSRVRGGM